MKCPVCGAIIHEVLVDGPESTPCPCIKCKDAPGRDCKYECDIFKMWWKANVPRLVLVEGPDPEEPEGLDGENTDKEVKP